MHLNIEPWIIVHLPTQVKCRAGVVSSPAEPLPRLTSSSWITPLDGSPVSPMPERPARPLLVGESENPRRAVGTPGEQRAGHSLSRSGIRCFGRLSVSAGGGREGMALPMCVLQCRVPRGTLLP